MYIVTSCYKYVPLVEVERLQVLLRALCSRLNILGRILIGDEGLNAAVCGQPEAIREYQEFLKAIPEFADMPFKDRSSNIQAYHKLVVRVRKEIVVFGHPVNMQNAAPYISPRDLHTSLSAHEEVVLLDARNDYETAIGTFAGAMTVPIENFREFASVATTLAPLKHKKIVTFCTGGIRCEKASAYLRDQGFTNVQQLHGGIINYLNEFPNGHFQGKCFVFDDRLEDGSAKPITNCERCGILADTYRNCFNLDCDRLFINCATCATAMKSTCSQDCLSAPRKRPTPRAPRKRVGRVLNYFAKSKIAHVEISDPIVMGENVIIAGKTTQDVNVRLSDVRDDSGNSITTAHGLVTIPVAQKVRKNDELLIEERLPHQ